MPTDVDVITCDDCGSEIESVEVNTVNGRTVCDSCLDEYSRCEDCEEMFPNDDLVCVGGDRYVCDSCSESYSDCIECGRTHYNDDMTYIDSGLVCRSCRDEYYTRCFECREWTHNEDARIDNVDNYYCESCADRVLEFNADEEVYYRVDSSNRSTSFRIESYNFKPRPIFNGTGTFHLGIELEIEFADSGKDKTLEELSHYKEHPFYLKSDGSLSDGCEIVTHPCTLAYHKRKFPWKPMLLSLIEAGALSHNTSTCGLHVHMSRKFFHASDIPKLVLFFGRCDTYMTRLARRKSEQWSKYVKKEKGRNAIKQLSRAHDRYVAVNLTNKSTVEIRIFRGTLKHDTLLASIELCEAVAQYVKVTGTAYIDTTPVSKLWDNFRTFVNKGEYAYLPAYMRRRGC